MNSRNHNLFKQFPIQGEVNISIGKVPTPYHIYDGFELFIGGVGDLEAVKELLRGEDVVPVQTLEGKAIMAIWVCDFTEANLNPHHELQFSIFVSRKEIPPIPDHPLNAFVCSFIHPEVKMMCHGLWNNTANVVAYNREVLSLNAIQTDSEIKQVGNEIEFVFKDSNSKHRIASGSVRNTSSLSATFSFSAKLGFQRALALARQPWVGMDVVNPKGVVLSRNAAAKAFVKSDTSAIHIFEPTEKAEIEHPLYKSLNFTPHAAQYMSGVKFVYLQPE